MPGLGCVAAGVPGEVATVESDASVSNSTTETVLAQLTIPANTARPGTTFHFEAWGNQDNDSNAGARTITFRLRMGGTGGTQVLSIAIATPALTVQTNKSWHVKGAITFRSVGATTATTWKAGMRLRDTTVSATSESITDSGATAVAGAAGSDSTAARDLALTVTWGTTAAGCVTRCLGGFVEMVRA